MSGLFWLRGTVLLTDVQPAGNGYNGAKSGRRGLARAAVDDGW